MLTKLDCDALAGCVAWRKAKGAGNRTATAYEWSAALHTSLGDPRYTTWQVAMTMVPEMCREGQERFHCPEPTLKALKLLTGNNFDSPAQWARWWHDNRTTSRFRTTNERSSRRSSISYRQTTRSRDTRP